MRLGMIGLGRMGSDMTRRLLRAGHRCVVYDVLPEAVRMLEQEGATPAGSLEEMARHNDSHSIINRRAIQRRANLLLCSYALAVIGLLVAIASQFIAV